MKTLLLLMLLTSNCFASQTIIAKGDVNLVSYFIELPNGVQEATVQVVQRLQNDDICDDAWLEGSVDEIKTARWGAIVDMYMADMSLSSFSWCKTQTKRDVVVKSREFKITKSGYIFVQPRFEVIVVK
jgi:hypothetical protein